MIALEEIRQLTLPEKFELLETVWSEIAADPDKIEVPRWHRDLLDKREEAMRSGQMEVLDWEEAKGQIEDAVR